MLGSLTFAKLDACGEVKEIDLLKQGRKQRMHGRE